MESPSPADLYRRATVDALAVAAVAGTEPSAPTGTTAADFPAGVEACPAGLAQPRAAMGRTP